MIVVLNLVLLNILILYFYENFIKILNIYDTPDNKLKLHKNKIPIVGGVIILLNYTILFFSYCFYDKDFILNYELNEIISISILIFGFFIIGFYDDKKILSPHIKILLSIMILFIGFSVNKALIVEKITLSFYDNKIFFGNFSIIFTIFCIILLSNSLNFFDGINGQSCVFFLFVFLYLTFNNQTNLFYLFNIVLIIFILILNLNHKLFLGDGGVYFMTMVISISLIYEHNLGTIVNADEIFLLLLLPGIDLVRLTILRVYKKMNPFYGDRKHIHHLLSNKFSLVTVNILLFLLSVFPLFLFHMLKLNFFIILIIFISIYLFSVLRLINND